MKDMFKLILYLLINYKDFHYVDTQHYKKTYEESSSEFESIDLHHERAIDDTKFNIRRVLEARSISEESMKVEVPTAAAITYTPKQIDSREGPFYNFIVNICKVILTKFQTSRIPKYFKILNRSLRGLGSGYLMKRLLNKFRRRLRKLSDFNGRKLKSNVQGFLTIISTRKPRADEFVQAVNSIFTIWEDNKMDDYIYELKRYGVGLTRRIGQRTRDVLENLIFRTYYKQKESVQNNIQQKFKEAVIEYLEDRKKSK